MSETTLRLEALLREALDLLPTLRQEIVHDLIADAEATASMGASERRPRFEEPNHDAPAALCHDYAPRPAQFCCDDDDPPSRPA